MSQLLFKDNNLELNYQTIKNVARVPSMNIDTYRECFTYIIINITSITDDVDLYQQIIYYYTLFYNMNDIIYSMQYTIYERQNRIRSIIYDTFIDKKNDKFKKTNYELITCLMKLCIYTLYKLCFDNLGGRSFLCGKTFTPKMYNMEQFRIGKELFIKEFKSLSTQNEPF